MKKRKKKIVLPGIDRKKLLLRTKRIGISALHAVTMIAFLLSWLRLDMSLSLEGVFLKWQAQLSNSSLAKKIYDRKYSIEDAIFVDVSSTREVVFDSLNLKKTVITDRRMLDTLFRLLNSQGEHGFILCDLDFTVSTNYDYTLDKTIRKIKRIGFPAQPTNTTSIKPLEKLPGGAVRYSYIGNFYKLADEMIKFKLVGAKGEKSLPLFMAETVKKVQLTKVGAFLKFSDKSNYYLNNMVVDDHINNAGLMKTANISMVFTPEDIIGMLRYQDAATSSDFIKNKVVVIGDMVNDMHNTAYGEMPGCLILYNIFLSLVNDENMVTFWWISFLFVMFTLLSYFIFYMQKSRLQEIINRFQAFMKRLILGDLLNEIFTNSIFLFLISLLSYFLFSKNVELIVLSLWLSAVEYIIGRVKAKEEWFKHHPSDLKSRINFLLINDKHESQ